jgi:hypothetical protein
MAFLGPFQIWAQTHTATLIWTDTLNPAPCSATITTGCTTYNVYRAPNACSLLQAPVFAKIADTIGALTYTDTGVSFGSYCYQVTATVAGSEGPPSPQWTATVSPWAPQSLTGTVK